MTEHSLTQPNKIFITTTGISKLELDIIKSMLPDNIILEEELTTSTNYLVTFKCIFSPKYFQAVKWKVPIVKIRWLYEIHTKPNKLFLYDNVRFSTSNISNDVFKNYFVAQGAVYDEDVSRSTEFLISENETENEVENISNENVRHKLIPSYSEVSFDKEKFCKKYDIPIINPIDVFKNNFELFSSTIKVAQSKLLFSEKTFLIDPNLPRPLFNALKRHLLEHDGKRISFESGADFIIGDSFSKYKKVYFYQWILDSIEYNHLLLPDFYEVRLNDPPRPLEGISCHISESLGENKPIMINKLNAMGARIRTRLDKFCNFCIVKSKTEKIKTPHKTVTFDWVDQCLYFLKLVREDRYILKNPIKKKEPCQKVSIQRSKEIKFQFTGLPSHFKNKAIEMLTKYKIEYSLSDKWENCTHLIMGKVNTSEKFLGSLANGAWILKPEFVEHLQVCNGNFNFQKYEWNAEGCDKADSKIVCSVPIWRNYILKTGKPAFSQWIVKLYCDGFKSENYERVLINGGAKICDKNFNKVFVAKGYKGEVLEKDVLSIDYMFAYLFKKCE